MSGTPGRSPRDWDDERLAAAFLARSDALARPAAGLAAAAIERIRSDRPGPRRFGWLTAASGVAAVVIVAVLGVVVVGSGLLVGRTPGPSQPPTGPTAAISAAGTAPAVGSSGALAGPASDVTLSVGEALAVRDASPESGEIQVSGWIRDGVAIPCPAPLHPANPARLDCPPAHPWIVEGRPDAGPGALNEAPAGPGFQPSFALVDADRVPFRTDGAPVQIAVTGHFHDRRASLCQESGCGSTFVVDRIDSVGGVAVGVTTSYALSANVESGDTTSSVELAQPLAADQLDAALRQVTEIAGPLQVINRRVMSVEAFLDAEPGLAAGWSGIGTARIVTALTAIETGEGSGPPLPRTFLFPDRSATFSEMTVDGPVVAGNLPVQVFLGLEARVGLPITVGAAIDRRDHALDAAELLVEGWAWAPGPLSCTLIRPGQPVLDQCPSTFTWLADRQPPRATGSEFPRPDGPAVNLVIPPESANLAALDTKPTRVSVLGHFDDHRAGDCPTGTVQRCRRNFIVDAVLDPDRPALADALAATHQPAPSNTPKGTASWAADVAGLPDAERSNRLISVFPVAVAALGALEPELAGTVSLADVDTVWLIHFLDQDVSGSPIVRTRLVIDADPDKEIPHVFDVTADGMSPGLSAAP